MLNPRAIMRLMNAKKQFSDNHPKFVAFLEAVFSGKLEEGTVLEVTVTKPGKEPVVSNIRLKASDLELLEELKGVLGNS